MQTKPKGVTTQMKALDENILMVLFVLFKRVQFLETKPKGVNTQMKAIDEYINPFFLSFFLLLFFIIIKLMCAIQVMWGAPHVKMDLLWKRRNTSSFVLE